MDRFNFMLKKIKDAGKILMTGYENLSANGAYFKSSKDIVTEKDIECEKFLTNEINKNFSDDTILAEESAGDDYAIIKNNKAGLWVIDPVDGTTNYLHGLPFFAISIAYLEKNEIRCGAVYLPRLDELFFSEKNNGAFLNEKKIKTTKTVELVNALGVTGFACLRADKPDNNLAAFCRLAPKIRGIRRFGAASADGCYVACGRFDFYWEKYLKPWDIMAAALIVREAGGKITDYENNPDNLSGNTVLFSNGILHDKLLELIPDTINKNLI